MAESVSDDGYILMAATMLKQFKKDVKYALKLIKPYREKKLNWLRCEAEDGVLSYVLDVAGITFDGIVKEVSQQLEDEINGNKRETCSNPIDENQAL